MPDILTSALNDKVIVEANAQYEDWVKAKDVFERVNKTDGIDIPVSVSELIDKVDSSWRGTLDALTDLSEMLDIFEQSQKTGGAANAIASIDALYQYRYGRAAYLALTSAKALDDYTGEAAGVDYLNDKVKQLNLRLLTGELEPHDLVSIPVMDDLLNAWSFACTPRELQDMERDLIQMQANAHSAGDQTTYDALDNARILISACREAQRESGDA